MLTSRILQRSVLRTPLLAAFANPAVANTRSFSTKSEEVPPALGAIGRYVFTDKIAKQYLEPSAYKAFQGAQRGKALDKPQKQAIAKGLQKWAFEHGAVNFAHWFSATRGSNAEKHDAFIDLDFKTGEIKAEFSGSKLFQGETDGSSFPNGGLRTTHSAAAYMSWDVTSPPFVRSDTLYIPAAFVTWNGEPLDDKTPLLRSQDAIEREGLRLLRALGDNKSERVIANVGWEQEFFLVDRENYQRRLDLIACGRTLLGKLPHKGQQTEANYFGRMPLRVRALMRDVQAEMWGLGISFNVMHNEVAPSQHEMSPVFTVTSRAADWNSVSLEVLQEVAYRHGMVALLHEKPFAGLNGSGKHCNWGLNTDTGANLFVPGDNAFEQQRFMTFVSALARTLNVHGDVIRIGVASESNDHRLGAQEAPPAIISLYTGANMHSHIEKIIQGGALEGYGKESRPLDFGAKAVQTIAASKEDRNRTTPFPFCGNRFELRAVGSNFNIAWPMALLNTAMADSMAELSAKIESGASVRDAVANNFKEHNRVIFNGNNYSEEWRQEATRRGIWHLKTTPEAIAQIDSAKNVKLFASHKVLSEDSVRARKEIMYAQYIEAVRIEASTLLEMLNTQIIPVLLNDMSKAPKDATPAANKFIQDKAAKYNKVIEEAQKLQDIHDKFPHHEDAVAQSAYALNTVKPQMRAVRTVTDAVERLVPHDDWPIPKYDELIYSHHIHGENEF